MDEWLSKTRYMHTMVSYSASKRNEILTYATWTNLEDKAMVSYIKPDIRGNDSTIRGN